MKPVNESVHSLFLQNDIENPLTRLIATEQVYPNPQLTQG